MNAGLHVLSPGSTLDQLQLILITSGYTTQTGAGGALWSTHCQERETLPCSEARSFLLTSCRLATLLQTILDMQPLIVHG